MKTLILILFVCLIPSQSTYLYSQSMDAGLSLVGRRNPEVKHPDWKNKISLSNSLGSGGLTGEKFVYNTLAMDLEMVFYSSTRVDVYVPVSLISGQIENIFGFGDLICTFTTYVPLGKLGLWGITYGAKLASGTADRDGLPLSYEPGQGTNDLILGFGKNTDNVNFYFGYQKPFGKSQNHYSQLRRGDDVSFRFGYTIPYKKTTIQAEIFAIKRIQKSNIYVHGTNPAEFTDVDNSNQIQLNLMTNITHMLADNIRLEIMGAIPLLKTDTNVDGLKRSFNISATVAYLFKMNF